MPSIKYNTDEQDNKKIIIKVDPETDETKVSCGCCACDGCGTISEILGGVTSLSFQVNAQYAVDGDSRSASGSGVLYYYSSSGCNAQGFDEDLTQYGCTAVAAFVGITKNSQGDCIATIYGSGYDGIIIGGPVGEDGTQTGTCATGFGIDGSVTVPVDGIIGTHVLQNLTGNAEGIVSPISITVTIS